MNAHQDCYPSTDVPARERPAQYRPGIVLAVAGLSLTACAAIPGNDKFKNISFDGSRLAVHAPVEVASGHIAADTFIRHDPYRLEPEADGVGTAANSCARPTDIVPFDGFTSEKAEKEFNTPNGPYIHFSPEQLPADIREVCKDDVDGKLWVAQSQLQPTDPTLPVVSPIR